MRTAIGDLDIEQVTSTDLQKAVIKFQFSDKTRSSRSPATLNRIKSAIRSFFEWACSTGRCSSNPAVTIKMARPMSRRTIAIEREEIHAFLKTISSSGDMQSLRDEALFSVYAFTGIRRSEALGLTIGDFDPKTHTLFIANPKGGVCRHQPIPLKVVRVLEQHIKKTLRQLKEIACKCRYFLGPIQQKH
jgi:integrase/recombinase XerC